MSAPKYKHSFRYAVDTLTGEETVLGKWPDLAVHSALVQYGFGDNDAFLRYAIFMGEGSGLHRVITDFADRKREALRLAGLKESSPRYKGAFEFTDPGVQMLRWTWLKLFSSRKFRAYIAACTAYDQNCIKVEQRITDSDTDIPSINLYIELNGHDEPEDAEQKRDELLESIAGIMAGRKKSLKADAEQRAIKLRNDLLLELPNQDELLSKLEAELFYGDKELKELAEQKASADGGGASWEDQIFGAKKK